MPEQKEPGTTGNPEEANSQAQSGEESSRPVDQGFSVGDFFARLAEKGDLDEQNRVEDEPAVVENDPLQALFQEQQASEQPGTSEGAQEGTPAGEGGDATGESVEDLQRRVLTAEGERARASQREAMMKQQVANLDPWIQLGKTVAENPELHQYVSSYMAGERPAAPQGVKDAAKAGGLTVPQFMQAVREMIREETATTVTQSAAAERQFTKTTERLMKDLPNFDIVADNPDYLGWVGIMETAISNGNLHVPEGKDRHEFAMRKAYDSLLASNENYQKAVAEAAKKNANLKAADKIAASTQTVTSRGQTDTKKPELTEDAKDRMRAVISYHRGAGFRKLPSAR